MIVINKFQANLDVFYTTANTHLSVNFLIFFISSKLRLLFFSSLKVNANKLNSVLKLTLDGAFGAANDKKVIL